MKNIHAQKLASLRWETKGQNYAVSGKSIQKPIKVNFRGKHWKTIRFTPSAFQDVKNFALALAVIAIPVIAGSLQHYLER